MNKQRSCTQWQQLLITLWPEETLSSEEYTDLKFHLARCAACADVAQSHQAMIVSLRARSTVTPLPKHFAQLIRLKEEAVLPTGEKPIYEQDWFRDQTRHPVPFSSSLMMEATNNQDVGTTPFDLELGDKIIPKRSPKRGVLALVATWCLVFLMLGGSVLVTQMPSSFIPDLFQQSQPLPTYRDFFAGTAPSSKNNRQDVKWTTTSSCQFLADGFHVIDLYEKGLQSCMANNLVLSDLDLSVDIKMNHAAFVTIYLQSKATAGHPIIGYYIRINTSGKYSVQYYASDAFSHNQLIVPWTIPDSKSLKTGEGNWNTVRIRLQEPEISLWFNSVDSKSKPDFTTGNIPSLPDNKGIIGFGAATSAVAEDQKPPLDVVFRNLTIYDLSKP